LPFIVTGIIITLGVYLIAGYYNTIDYFIPNERKIFISNIFMRLAFGFWMINFGLISLKIYYNKDKDNGWGKFYKSLIAWRGGIWGGWFVLSGGLGIIAGITAILFGFNLSK